MNGMPEIRASKKMIQYIKMLKDGLTSGGKQQEMIGGD